MVTTTVKRIQAAVAVPVENRHTHQPLKLNNDSCGKVRMNTAAQDIVGGAQINSNRTSTRVEMGVMNHHRSPHKKVAFPLYEDEIKSSSTTTGQKRPHLGDDDGKNKRSLGEGKKNTDHLHKVNGCRGDAFSPHKKVAFPLREDDIKSSSTTGQKRHNLGDDDCRGDDFSDLGIFHKSRAEIGSKKNQRHIGNYDRDVDTVKDCAFALYDQSNKSRAEISSKKNQRHIGNYDRDVDTVKDRASGSAFALYDQNMQAEQRSHASSKEKLDLTGIPEQPLILKHNSHYRRDALLSKYAGVTWINSMTKWEAQIRIHGEMRHIGYYDEEKDAAKDFARASYKYKSESIDNLCAGSDEIECRKTQQRNMASLEKIDLTDVPKQQLIIKPNGKGNSSSKYKGVTFLKTNNKWQAKITIDGERLSIGSYDKEEDAAAAYSLAFSKNFQSKEGVMESSV